MSERNIPPELLPYLLHEKIDNSSLQHSIITVNSIFLALIWVTTGLRSWVRFRMLRSAGPDDVLIIVALIFATLMSISTILGESFGLGKHIWNLSPNYSDLPGMVGKTTKTLYGAYLSYSTAITFTKFSIMATYVRIFPQGFLRRIVYAIAVVTFCFWIASIFAVIFNCIPVRAAWDYSLQGKCFPLVDFFYASAAVNIATDILLCCLPIHTLWALNLPKPQRIVLIILFSMGTFACVASVLRLTHLSSLRGGFDITYVSVSSLNWSIIEVDTGIVCASISALRPLAKRVVPKLFPYSSRPSSPSIPLYKPLNTHTTEQSNTFQSISQPPLAKTVSSNAIAATSRQTISSSVESTKSEIYVKKTFEVETMKDLPELPDPLPSHSKTSQAGEMVPISAPPNTLSRNDGHPSPMETIPRLPIPRQRPSISIFKGKGKSIDQIPKLEPTRVVQDLKWPANALTKGKQGLKALHGRQSVVGMFTADMLDATSSDDEKLAGRSCTGTGTRKNVPQSQNLN